MMTYPNQGRAGCRQWGLDKYMITYKLEQTFERMQRLLEMRETLKQTYTPKEDTSWGDDDGYYASLNDSYKKFYRAFDAVIADEAARIGKLAKE